MPTPIEPIQFHDIWNPAAKGFKISQLSNTDRACVKSSIEAAVSCMSHLDGADCFYDSRTATYGASYANMIRLAFMVSSEALTSQNWATQDCDTQWQMVKSAVIDFIREQSSTCDRPSTRQFQDTFHLLSKCQGSVGRELALGNAGADPSIHLTYCGRFTWGTEFVFHNDTYLPFMAGDCVRVRMNHWSLNANRFYQFNIDRRGNVMVIADPTMHNSHNEAANVFSLNGIDVDALYQSPQVRALRLILCQVNIRPVVLRALRTYADANRGLGWFGNVLTTPMTRRAGLTQYQWNIRLGFNRSDFAAHSRTLPRLPRGWRVSEAAANGLPVPTTARRIRAAARAWDWDRIPTDVSAIMLSDLQLDLSDPTE
jgi:hypothetical protein